MTDLTITQRSSFRGPRRRLAWPLLFLLLPGLLDCARPRAATENAVRANTDRQAAARATPAPPPRKPAHIMGPEGADWLERKERDQEEKPEVVLAAMDLRPGMTVAEIGAGTGYFSRRLARAVGPDGKVYANEIQPEMLKLLKGYAAKEGITNIVPVLGTGTDPKLPAGQVDRLLLVDVYHEFQKPKVMLARIRDSLAPGGTVTLIEYRREDVSASHIAIDHRMSVEQVLAEWTPAGFDLVKRSEELPAQHLFVFTARPGAPPVS